MNKGSSKALPALADHETSHIYGVYPIFVSFLNKMVTEMTRFTTMTLVCLYYTYFGQQLEKGKLAIIHKLNMYIT